MTHMDHQYGVKSGFPNLKPGSVPVFTAHFPIYRTPSDSVLADLSIDYTLGGAGGDCGVDVHFGHRAAICAE
ncbi:hypothetical protein ACFTAO_41455 [Paenibacillus rhizoplanae]